VNSGRDNIRVVFSGPLVLPPPSFTYLRPRQTSYHHVATSPQVKRIVIVEDQTAIREMLAEILRIDPS
jgi:hypothetical protein